MSALPQQRSSREASGSRSVRHERLKRTSPIQSAHGSKLTLGSPRCAHGASTVATCSVRHRYGSNEPARSSCRPLFRDSLFQRPSDLNHVGGGGPTSSLGQPRSAALGTRLDCLGAHGSTTSARSARRARPIALSARPLARSARGAPSTAPLHSARPLDCPIVPSPCSARPLDWPVALEKRPRGGATIHRTSAQLAPVGASSAMRGSAGAIPNRPEDPRRTSFSELDALAGASCVPRGRGRLSWRGWWSWRCGDGARRA